MVRYHDEEWGLPCHDDRALFELLTLESAQAGLSWNTILNKREGYRRAFANFDVDKVASYGSDNVERLMGDASIVRNRSKIESTIGNAQALIAVRDEVGSFDTYIWWFVFGEPKRNAWRSMDEVPASSAEAVAMSADLKKRGFRIVGPTICYAFMQAAGLVNDHEVSCFRYAEV
jgi:DNA-3-methyladenine glycosylase I